MGKQSLQVTFFASHRNKFKLFLIQGFLCDQIHTARALGFRQRINTPEFYWLSSYKATAINARNFCIRMSAELGNLKFRTKVSMISNSIKLLWYETRLAFKN